MEGRRETFCLSCLRKPGGVCRLKFLCAKESLPVHREGAEYDTRVPGRTEEEADRDKKNRVSG